MHKPNDFWKPYIGRFWYFEVQYVSGANCSFVSGLWQNSVTAPYGRDWEPRYSQTHPSASDFHEYHSDTPTQPPDIPQTPTRHLQGAGDANRQQQTPPDTNRQPQTPKDTDKCCLSTAGDVCCRLLTSLAPWRCLGGVWEMSGGYLGVSEWYSWKSKALGCVWGYLGSQSLQYGAVTLFCHNPETKE